MEQANLLATFSEGLVELDQKMTRELTNCKFDIETTEIRDKIQFDKKSLIAKFEEVEDEMQKEAKLVRTQLQREREETKESILSEAKILQGQIDSVATDFLDIMKKERA